MTPVDNPTHPALCSGLGFRRPRFRTEEDPTVPLRAGVGHLPSPNLARSDGPLV